jgi:hypothetical protein
MNAVDRRLLDDAVVVECSDLTEEELAWYRPEAYRILARRSRERLHLKSHDAYTQSADGEPLIPPPMRSAPTRRSSASKS